MTKFNQVELVQTYDTHCTTVYHLKYRLFSVINQGIKILCNFVKVNFKFLKTLYFQSIIFLNMNAYQSYYNFQVPIKITDRFTFEKDMLLVKAKLIALFPDDEAEIRNKLFV